MATNLFEILQTGSTPFPSQSFDAGAMMPTASAMGDFMTPSTMPMNSPVMTDEQMIGLLGVDRNRALQRGLLAAAAPLLRAGAGGSRPQDASIGLALGQAGMMGMDAYDKSRQRDMAQGLARMQLGDKLQEQQFAQRLGVPSSLVSPVVSALIGKSGKETFSQMTGADLLQRFPNSGLDPKGMYNVSSTGKITQVGQPTTNINLDQSGTKELNKLAARDINEIDQQARNAVQARDRINLQYSSLPEDTGPGTSYQNFIDTTIAAGSKIFGFNVDPKRLRRITNFQGYKSLLSSSVMLELMRQKGPQTEGDAQRARSIFMDVDNTQDANKFIRDYQLALEDRKIERANFINPQLEDGPQLRKSFSKASRDWAKFTAQTPLVARIKQKTRDGNFVTKPMFYNQYLKQAAGRGISRNDAIGMWRQLTKGKAI